MDRMGNIEVDSNKWIVLLNEKLFVVSFSKKESLKLDNKPEQCQSQRLLAASTCEA